MKAVIDAVFTDYQANVGGNIHLYAAPQDTPHPYTVIIPGEDVPSTQFGGKRSGEDCHFTLTFYSLRDLCDEVVGMFEQADSNFDLTTFEISGDHRVRLCERISSLGPLQVDREDDAIEWMYSATYRVTLGKVN